MVVAPSDIGRITQKEHDTCPTLYFSTIILLLGCFHTTEEFRKYIEMHKLTVGQPARPIHHLALENKYIWASLCTYCTTDALQCK